jgi:hypothetical protein
LASHHPSEEPTMTTEAKCLEYARECARRAQLVTNSELRERLLNIARNWTERATREDFTSDREHRLASREVTEATIR